MSMVQGSKEKPANFTLLLTVKELLIRLHLIGSQLDPTVTKANKSRLPLSTQHWLTVSLQWLFRNPIRGRSPSVGSSELDFQVDSTETTASCKTLTRVTTSSSNSNLTRLILSLLCQDIISKQSLIFLNLNHRFHLVQ